MASGGFGCIFKPALKCKGKTERIEGVSKMSVEQHGKQEMSEIERIKVKLSKIKNYQKKYIFIGFSAWLLLIPLAITSSQKMMKLLKHNWKKLHKLVYVIAIFGSLHYIWLSKSIFFKPLIFMIIILVLLALRIKIKKRETNYG